MRCLSDKRVLTLKLNSLEQSNSENIEISKVRSQISQLQKRIDAFANKDYAPWKVLYGYVYIPVC